MAITLDQIIDELETNSPLGIILPRDGNTNETKSSTIERWARDGTQAINERRGRTTTKEVLITQVDSVQDYTLPTDCKRVVKIDRPDGISKTAAEFGSVSDLFIRGIFAGGTILPTGQEVSGSVDLIRRQHLTRIHQEDDWELIAGKIRLNFPITAGEVIRVTYQALDRSFETLPDDHFTLLLDYLRWCNLDWYVNKTGGFNDRSNPEGTANAFRIRAELEARWKSGVAGLTPEAV